MRNNWPSFFSAFGVPLLGLGALLLALWHPNPALKPTLNEQETIFLLDPDPRLDRALTVCLRQQAKEVVRCRERVQALQAQSAHADLAAKVCWRRDGLAQAVDDYNLVAKECTPAVFTATGLPPALTP